MWQCSSQGVGAAPGIHSLSQCRRIRSMSITMNRAWKHTIKLPAVAEASPVTEASSGSSESIESPWCELLYILKETTAFFFFWSCFTNSNLLPLKYCPFCLWIGKIKLPLSTKSAVTFSEGDARQDNTDVRQGPSVVTPRPITRLETKQALKGERENSP